MHEMRFLIDKIAREVGEDINIDFNYDLPPIPAFYASPSETLLVAKSIHLCLIFGLFAILLLN